MKATPTELSRVRFFRERRDKTDVERMNGPHQVKKYRAFLDLYEYLRAHRGEWVDKHDAAQVMGMSTRQARRWILLYKALKYPHIEVVLGATGGLPSRIRWR